MLIFLLEIQKPYNVLYQPLFKQYRKIHEFKKKIWSTFTLRILHKIQQTHKHNERKEPSRYRKQGKYSRWCSWSEGQSIKLMFHSKDDDYYKFFFSFSDKPRFDTLLDIKKRLKNAIGRSCLDTRDIVACFVLFAVENWTMRF